MDSFLCGMAPIIQLIFLGKKMAAGIFFSTRHSDWLFEAKNSEFYCEMNF
jgi:hypothetical protein